MEQAKRTVWIIGALAILLPAAAFLLPALPPSAAVRPEEFQGLLLASILNAWLNIGAGILFLMGLKGFKATLHRAYFAICTGLLATSLTFIQLPFLLWFDLYGTPWFLNGGVTFPFALATFFFYIGLRTFAGALNVKTRWTNPWAVMPVVFVLAVLGGWFVGDHIFYGEFAGDVIINCLGFINLILAWQVKRRAGPAYTNALAWFWLALALYALAAFLPAFYIFFEMQQPPVLALPSLIASLVFIKAGYAFNKIKDY